MNESLRPNEGGAEDEEEAHHSHADHRSSGIRPRRVVDEARPVDGAWPFLVAGLLAVGSGPSDGTEVKDAHWD